MSWGGIHRKWDETWKWRLGGWQGGYWKSSRKNAVTGGKEMVTNINGGHEGELYVALTIIIISGCRRARASAARGNATRVLQLVLARTERALGRGTGRDGRRRCGGSEGRKLE